MPAYTVPSQTYLHNFSKDLAIANNEQMAANLAPTFSTATAYEIDDVVTYHGALYKFKVAHAAGAWNSAHVDSITVLNLGGGSAPSNFRIIRNSPENVSSSINRIWT